MYKTIAVNEDTNECLETILNAYKKKYNLKKLSRSKLILKSLESLKQQEGL
jgi:hypothetical protein